MNATKLTYLKLPSFLTTFALVILLVTATFAHGAESPFKALSGAWSGAARSRSTAARDAGCPPLAPASEAPPIADSGAGPSLVSSPRFTMRASVVRFEYPPPSR